MSINPQLLVADTANRDASESEGADEQQELGEREFFVGTWSASPRQTDSELPLIDFGPLAA